jgi:hypothetical protein
MIRHLCPRTEWLGEIIFMERHVAEQDFAVFGGPEGFQRYCVMQRDWCIRDQFPDLAARIQEVINSTIPPKPLEPQS